ncbi:GntR family transcriptional regulator [Streptomyces lavendofoliae]|uniref:GntR family transcriptional regulator n=1 Tax=Streptomyces lavendofoliae TaxID=67314 RepID=A0A918I1L5_9ACTN|nr:GntR family transcriptional regulator [Streptomyces lavendofoliae]GGU52379.1 GntR family transcriptional regulator [Streptomyces lavendofoliae]
MAKPHEDKRPLAERIAANLRQLIMSGDWEPGSKIPTTEDLVGEYGASNVTIQRALGILKTEGLLEGRAGSGVYVRERATQTIQPASFMAPAEDGQPYRWVTEAAKRSQRGANRLLFVGESAPPRRVRAVLGLADGEVAVLRSRVGLLDDEPAEVVDSYYPVDLARGTGLADRRKIPGGSPTLLAAMGYSPREQEDEVSSRPATTREYVHLELPADIPVIEVFRVVYSDDRRPIEVTTLVKPAHLFKMGYRLPLH